MIIDTDNLISAKELQRALNICYRTVYLWREEGMPVVKMPKRLTNSVFYDVDKVKQWIEYNKYDRDYDLSKLDIKGKSNER